MKTERVYDLLITNGRVIDPLTRFDGTARVGVIDGIISLVEPGNFQAEELKATKVIDASGKVVAPGFINVHGHEGVLKETIRTAALDGVTTTVGGQCGFSPGFPNRQEKIEDFYSAFGDGELVGNYIGMAGHNALRNWSGITDPNTPANAAQIDQMRRHLHREMEAGALGLSFGPAYHPGVSFEEMVALAKETYKLGGMSSIHIRFPIPPMNVEAFREAVNLAEASGVPLIISHVTGTSYGGTHGDTGQALEIIARGLQKGLKLAADSTQHDAMVTILSIPLLDLAPPEVLLEAVDAKIGDFRVMKTVTINGKTQLRALESFSSVEQLIDVREKVKQGQITDPFLIGHIFKPHKQWLANSMPFMMVENDAWVEADEKTGELMAHPRLAGTFSRFFGFWVRESGVTDLITGLYKCSSAAALFCGLENKGRIQEGCDADLVIFDPEEIIDTSDYARDSWHSAPRGIDRVMVNGIPVVEQGEYTGNKPGQVIRRNWQVPGRIPGPWGNAR